MLNYASSGQNVLKNCGISIWGLDEVKYGIMRKIFLAFVLLPMLFFLVVGNSTVFAQLSTSGCGNISVTSSDFVDVHFLDNSTKTVTFRITGLTPGGLYNIDVNGDYSAVDKGNNYPFNADAAGTATVTTELRSAPFAVPFETGLSLFKFSLHRDLNGNGDKICDLGVTQVRNKITSPTEMKCSLRIWQVYEDPTSKQQVQCYANATANSCLQRSSSVFVEAAITDKDNNILNNVPIDIQLNPRNWDWKGGYTDLNGKITQEFDRVEKGEYSVEVSIDRTGINNIFCNNLNFDVEETCADANGNRSCSKDSTPIDTPTDDEFQSYSLCSQIPDSTAQAKCRDCANKGQGGDKEQGGVWTAVGCIERDPLKITERLIAIGLGMGGGVALIATLAGGFILSTSQGDPQKTSQAKEIITNAIIGLLFIIFSVVILQFIGVTIFNIPGFGSVQN
jgi:hypothetical protein